MDKHRSILKNKLREVGLTQKEIASRMGWSSQGTVSAKLNGDRDWSEGELARMCELAGITIVELAALSGDMSGFFKRQGVAEGASILEALNDDQFEAIMHILRVMYSGNHK